MRMTTIAVVTGAAGIAFGAAAQAGDMTNTQFRAATRSIEASHKSERAHCAQLLANAKSVCTARADGRKAIATADLALAQQSSRKTLNGARIARTQAEHRVAIQRCEDRSGAARDACVKDADAALSAARAGATAKRRMTNAYKAARTKYAAELERVEEQVAGHSR